MSFDTKIHRVNSGTINQVNDASPGMTSTPMGPNRSHYLGELGQGIWLDDSQIVCSTAAGFKQVYGGHFRYVRLAAAATAVVAGQLVFWDLSVADNLYQVTTSEAVSADAAMFRAGVVLNPSWAAGYYSFIQDVGPVFVKFRAVLTDAGILGSRCFCAAAGAGADNGLADVFDDANPATFGDVGRFMSRYLGEAIAAPVGGALSLVYLNAKNTRG
jgi:hypothetical protein